ncbi:MAG: hypothetical protein WB762_04155 [Candidatus Sulfotelmatobacter sp.]
MNIYPTSTIACQQDREQTIFLVEDETFVGKATAKLLSRAVFEYSLRYSPNTRSRSRSLIAFSVGGERIQRNFELMRQPVEPCQRSELTDLTARVVIYEGFVEGKLEAPKHLARTVHDLYFEPKYEEFPPEDDLESFERVHLRVQGIESHAAIQNNCQAGRVPGG